MLPPRLGQVEWSMRLVQESLAVSPTEPETHFLLANLYAAKVSRLPS